MSQYLEQRPELVKGKCVCELGAGGGLPGLVAAKEGAEVVVISDYPDQDLMDNIEDNIRRNGLEQNAKAIVRAVSLPEKATRCMIF